jgi:Fe-S oxidoreductase
LAARNISQFRELGVSKIITLDPHAFNSLTKEYPAMGGCFEVAHYTQILAALVKDRRLTPSPFSVKVAYHDPCYLGRHRGIYDAPRQVLRSVPGLELVEMRRNRANAFCCGGGGGNFFTDIIGAGEQSPARVRLKDALETGAEVIAVGCPLCSKMLDDAVKTEGLTSSIRVQDVSEILLGAIRNS